LLKKRAEIIPDPPVSSRAETPSVFTALAFSDPIMALTPDDVAASRNWRGWNLGRAEATDADQLNGFFEHRRADERGRHPRRRAALHAAVGRPGGELRLRDDAVTESRQRAANQASAPAVEDGLFLVPKVIE
jgi:aspartyl-tRNA(Asn)/glutamyl-tRNA(Gln) amidotransferase subunit C